MSDPMSCTKCGQAHDRCTAHNQRGKPCRHHPMPGLRVCRYHGGLTPRAVRAGERRVAEAEARELLGTYGGEEDIGPVEALLREVRWAAGHVSWLRARVREIEETQLTVGVSEQKINPDGGKTVTIKTAPHILLELYDSERKRLAELSALAVRAGVEQHQIRIVQETADEFEKVLRALLGLLGLSPRATGVSSRIVSALDVLDGGERPPDADGGPLLERVFETAAAGLAQSLGLDQLPVLREWLDQVLVAVSDGRDAPEPPPLRAGQVRELTTGPGVPEPPKLATLADEGWLYVEGEGRYVRAGGGDGG